MLKFARLSAIVPIAVLLAVLLQTDFHSVASGAPTKAGEGDGKKKLVGVWEGTDDDFKGKDGNAGTITVEFKADGKMKVSVGPFEMAGTWKLAKEEGKKMTIDTEISLPDLGGGEKPKSKAMSFSITFEDANTIEMTPTDKKDPKKLTRKK